ncbi:MAG: histidinol-phosphate transaminase, partial [Sandaracinobacteroides sp.]
GALTAEALHTGLADRGFITRWLPGQGLPDGLRISVGTEAETAGVIAALTEIAEAA